MSGKRQNKQKERERERKGDPQNSKSNQVKARL